MATPGDVDAFDDEEALRWAGDDERGREAPRVPSVSPGAALTPEDDDEVAEAPGGRGRRIALVAFVIPYLARTIGWVLSVQQLDSGATDLLREILWQFGEFLAILVAPLWFAATLTLTRDSRPLVRVGWLALGLGLLLPWPILLRLVAAVFFVGSVS